MIYLDLKRVLRLHDLAIHTSGGTPGIRDLGLLESALAQPRMSFGGEDLYPTLVEKAAALGFSLAKNHPVIDGNKRIAHAAVEAFLLLNRHEIDAMVDEQERVILGVADGSISRESFREWLTERVVPHPRNMD